MVDPGPREPIILSPGPGCPDDYPETRALYLRWRGRNPILGVCLGFQIIIAAEGGRVLPQPRVMHGYQTEAEFLPEAVAFRGITPPLKVARYHSLMVDPEHIPPSFQCTAWDPQSKVPLAVEHRTHSVQAVQFHPDSFLTPMGSRIIANVMDLFLV